MPLRIYTYDPHDGDFFIAESPEEADALFTDWCGSTVAYVTEGDDDYSWRAIPDDKVFKVHFEEDDHGPERHEHELPAFFCEKYGKGYLCSRNY